MKKKQVCLIQRAKNYLKKAVITLESQLMHYQCGQRGVKNKISQYVLFLKVSGWQKIVLANQNRRVRSKNKFQLSYNIGTRHNVVYEKKMCEP